MNWKQLNDVSVNRWASKAQKDTAKTIQVRIDTLRTKQEALNKMISDGHNTPIDTIIDWGNPQKDKAVLLIEELGIRKDILVYIDIDKQEHSAYVAKKATEWVAKKTQVLEALKGVGYTKECLMGSDIVMRHPEVKALTLEQGGVYGNDANDHRETIARIEGELKALRQSRVI